MNLAFGNGWKIHNATAEQANVLTARDKFVREYCQQHSWDDELSITQVMEIRRQDGWKNAGVLTMA